MVLPEDVAGDVGLIGARRGVVEHQADRVEREVVVDDMTGLTVELVDPPSVTAMPSILPMTPSFSMTGVIADAPEVDNRDAGAGVNDVVFIDKDIGIDDRHRDRVRG